MSYPLCSHHADLLLHRGEYIYTLKATFGMYHGLGKPPAAVNYERHITTDVGTEASVPRSKFAM